MAGKELEELLSSCEYAGPVAASSILDLERKLGVQLPSSYKAFLSRFGAAMFPGGELAGIPSDDNDPPYWLDVFTSTSQLRRVSRSQHELVLVADDGSDFKFYLDTARLSDGECPVVVLGPGRDFIEVAPSFEEFAIRWIKDELPY